LEFTGKCIRKILRFWLIKSKWFEQVTIWQTYSTLLVQHHGVVNSEMLAFIVFWNQTLQILMQVLEFFKNSLRTDGKFCHQGLDTEIAQKIVKTYQHNHTLERSGLALSDGTIGFLIQPFFREMHFLREVTRLNFQSNTRRVSNISLRPNNSWTPTIYLRYRRGMNFSASVTVI
jgi:hypothetical protein